MLVWRHWAVYMMPMNFIASC